jgi:uncharacterized protein with HEPN domain
MVTGLKQTVNEKDLKQLKNMLESANAALVFVHGRSKETMFNDSKLIFALVRAIEIVAEAADTVSEAGRRQYPHFPWAYTIDMPNRIVYGDSDINLDRMWVTVTEEIPVLISKLKQMIPVEDSYSPND